MLTPGFIGAAVVGDRDAGGKRELLAQVKAETPDARSQIAFLVLDRDDDVYLRRREFATSHGTSGIGEDVKWLHAAQLRLPYLVNAERRFCARYEIFIATERARCGVIVERSLFSANFLQSICMTGKEPGASFSPGETLQLIPSLPPAPRLSRDRCS